MKQTDWQGETERALRAATCTDCARDVPMSEDDRLRGEWHTRNGEHWPCQSKHAELLPLFNAGMAGAYAAAAKAVEASRDKIGRIMHESWTRTKRAQGFHHPSKEKRTVMCDRCHPDLVDWDALPQQQKDINLHAFDDVLPMLIDAILALTPADAQNSELKHVENNMCEHCNCATCKRFYELASGLLSCVMVDLQNGHKLTGELSKCGNFGLRVQAAIASAAARARLEAYQCIAMEVTNLLAMAVKCDSSGMAETPQKEWTPYQGKILAYEHILDRCAELGAAARTPDSAKEPE